MRVKREWCEAAGTYEACFPTSRYVSVQSQHLHGTPPMSLHVRVHERPTNSPTSLRKLPPSSLLLGLDFHAIPCSRHRSFLALTPREDDRWIDGKGWHVYGAG